MAIKTVTIVDGNNYYFFDCVLRVSKALTGESSTYAMEDGYSSVDNYSNTPNSIEISGIISSAKMITNTAQTTDMGDFLNGIEKLKESGRVFSVTIGRRHQTLQGCLFSSVSYSHTETTGENSAEVSMTISQQRTARAAQIVSTPIPFQAYMDTVAITKEGSGSGESVDINSTSVKKIRADMLNYVTQSEKPK